MEQLKEELEQIIACLGWHNNYVDYEYYSDLVNNGVVESRDIWEVRYRPRIVHMTDILYDRLILKGYLDAPLITLNHKIHEPEFDDFLSVSGFENELDELESMALVKEKSVTEILHQYGYEMCIVEDISQLQNLTIQHMEEIYEYGEILFNDTISCMILTVRNSADVVDAHKKLLGLQCDIEYDESWYYGLYYHSDGQTISLFCNSAYYQQQFMCWISFSMQAVFYLILAKLIVS